MPRRCVHSHSSVPSLGTYSRSYFAQVSTFGVYFRLDTPIFIYFSARVSCTIAVTSADHQAKHSDKYSARTIISINHRPDTPPPPPPSRRTRFVVEQGSRAEPPAACRWFVRRETSRHLPSRLDLYASRTCSLLALKTPTGSTAMSLRRPTLDTTKRPQRHLHTPAHAEIASPSHARVSEPARGFIHPRPDQPFGGSRARDARASVAPGQCPQSRLARGGWRVCAALMPGRLYYA